MTDESIETKAKVNINAADEGYDAAHLSVVSFNGFVLLVGQVPSEELKTLATDVVRRIEDVRRLQRVGGGRSNRRGRANNDTWITTQVKSKLLASSDTPGRRVKVVTENSVVYLMGLLTEAEAERVSLEAAEVGGAERVQLFELIGAAYLTTFKLGLPRLAGGWVCVGILCGVEHHSLAILSRVYPQNRFDRHGDISGDSAKTPVEINIVVTHIQTHHCGGRDIQNDLPIADISLRDLHPLHLNVDQKMRRAIVVHDPLVNRADDIGAAGVQVRRGPEAHLSLL